MPNRLPDPLPLGVSGAVTIPLKRYISLVGRAPDPSSLLLGEDQRIAYLGVRIAEALDRPLTSPGSEGFAKLVFSHFRSVDLVQHFAAKAMQTLRDGAQHSFVALSPDDVRIAISFVAWSGSHREIQSQRFGSYLSALFGTARRLVDQGAEPAGFLEVDAYLRDEPELDDPGRPLEDVFAVEIEYSYLPGFAFGSPNKTHPSLPKVLLINPDLCTPEENQAFEKPTAR